MARCAHRETLVRRQAERRVVVIQVFDIPALRLERETPLSAGSGKQRLRAYGALDPQSRASSTPIGPELVAKTPSSPGPYPVHYCSKSCIPDDTTFPTAIAALSTTSAPSALYCSPKHAQVFGQLTDALTISPPPVRREPRHTFDISPFVPPDRAAETILKPHTDNTSP